MVKDDNNVKLRELGGVFFETKYQQIILGEHFQIST